jgi:hypothetical protein
MSWPAPGGWVLLMHTAVGGAGAQSHSSSSSESSNSMPSILSSL